MILYRRFNPSWSVTDLLAIPQWQTTFCRE